MKSILQFIASIFIAIFSVLFSQPKDTALHVGDTVPITWNSLSITAEHVEFIVMRQTSISPKSFDLIRVIHGLPNSGLYNWLLTAEDIGTSTWYQIGGDDASSTLGYMASEFFGPFVIK